jgi:hypothetical protein
MQGLIRRSWRRFFENKQHSIRRPCRARRQFNASLGASSRQGAALHIIRAQHSASGRSATAPPSHSKKPKRAASSEVARGEGLRAGELRAFQSQQRHRAVSVLRTETAPGNTAERQQ